MKQKKWPPESLIIDDIKSEKSYVGVFYYDYGYRIEPAYNKKVEGNG